MINRCHVGWLLLLPLPMGWPFYSERLLINAGSMISDKLFSHADRPAVEILGLFMRNPEAIVTANISFHLFVSTIDTHTPFNR